MFNLEMTMKYNKVQTHDFCLYLQASYLQQFFHPTVLQYWCQFHQYFPQAVALPAPVAQRQTPDFFGLFL